MGQPGNLTCRLQLSCLVAAAASCSRQQATSATTGNAVANISCYLPGFWSASDFQSGLCACWSSISSRCCCAFVTSSGHSLGGGQLAGWCPPCKRAVTSPLYKHLATSCSDVRRGDCSISQSFWHRPVKLLSHFTATLMCSQV